METRYDRPRLAAASGIRSLDGGADRDRTGDLLRAKQALSQLSYSPLRLTSSPAALLLIARLAGHESPAQASRAVKVNATLHVVGLGGFEPPTSPLSGVRSDQLSYRPVSAIPYLN